VAGADAERVVDCQNMIKQFFGLLLKRSSQKPLRPRKLNAGQCRRKAKSIIIVIIILITIIVIIKVISIIVVVCV